MTTPGPKSTAPAIFAQWSSENFVVGGGVAIFHLASQRVVICSTEDRHGRTYYFLPKGRRDAGEESGRGAEREGYEEVRLHMFTFIHGKGPIEGNLSGKEYEDIHRPETNIYLYYQNTLE